MRALWRYFLAPLVVAGALFSAAAPAYHAATAAPHRTIAASAHDCPYGTIWNAQTGTCT